MEGAVRRLCAALFTHEVLSGAHGRVCHTLIGPSMPGAWASPMETMQAVPKNTTGPTGQMTHRLRPHTGAGAGLYQKLNLRLFSVS